MFNAAEKHQSQVPALQLLVQLGFTPLSQDEVARQRGGRLRNVLLENILAEQLLKLNRFTFRGTEYPFDVADAHEAIRKLVPEPDKLKGLNATSQDTYDTLVLGTAISKTIDGDTKSHHFNYIDWIKPGNNVFHVTAELRVERTGSVSTKRCDVVAYVNGIPFIVIENKRPTENIKKAGSQLISYQNADNIPQLFHFAQLLIAMNRQEAIYATVGTPQKFWSIWRDDEDSESDISEVINTPLTEAQKQGLFSGDMASACGYFDELTAEGDRLPSAQDRLIYALCRPERLLDLVRRFTVFDGGKRKIARHQQFFAVRKTLDRVVAGGAGPNGSASSNGKPRNGGVIWHTQGSGKSLTMVILGKALALEPRLNAPRIMIVTDREDLDKQITGTFRSCDLTPVRATTGTHLAELIRDKTPLITTIINKFENAAKVRDADISKDIFVLVDESHRTQTGRRGGYGSFHVAMRRLLPNACYMGFTGTPLMKGDKSTAATFGGLIHRYTIDQAVADGAVVPLLYEGRWVEQNIAENVIDKWFEKISEGLTDEQRMDLKRKFSRIDVLGKTGQTIRAKAFDISEHYRKFWQGTGFKAQLVAPDKASAIRFKQVMDEIGHVSSEVVISAPNEYEGVEQVDAEATGLVREFWDRQMEKYGGEAAYNSTIIDAFKESGGPEILIVVSKLLTGFDAPRNTVLYLCKSLRDHSLLQAVARVNRLFEDETAKKEKEFGFVIDYEGLLGNLDDAMGTYSALGGYDDEDLAGAVHDVREQIRLLPQRWADVWDLFRKVPNKLDMEALEQFLEPEDLRAEFYAVLRVFGRCLHIALSSDKLLDVCSEHEVEKYRADWKQFTALRRAVQLRYQEVVDLREYEPKIQRLLDDHVTAMPAETIVELVNINDPAALRAVVEEEGTTTASKADRIVSALKKTIKLRMEEDPAFYKKFSTLLQEAIEEYRRTRDAEKYLLTAKELAGKTAAKDHGEHVPALIRGNNDAIAVYGVVNEVITELRGSEALTQQEFAKVAVDLIHIVDGLLIVGMWSNHDRQNELRTALEDYIYEELGDGLQLHVDAELLDTLPHQVINVAKARFPR
ncbi:type I restriction endonuclease subunit R [Arthrobacter sp. HY1533]|uniref:type I restriction endonuclease subunit R n=1 Tax=Arthrobacter sp. HY1533 TaxID=2970919 RepID=UPI0022B9E0F0|nr:HsdR family type I site-specific deoxyribonuclease [Arthrobacter sp. HY1533]